MPFRPTTPADVPHLVALTAATGVFNDLEVHTLEGVIRDYFKSAYDEEGHRCFTAEGPDGLTGFVYLAPDEMAVGAWELWWVVVAKPHHGKGIGGELLGFAEQFARTNGGRVITLDTSSTPAYVPTHRFYEKYGYKRVGTLPEYYRDGDDKVIFWKRVDTI